MRVKFKNILNYSCGIRFIFENLKLSSPLSTHFFLESPIITDDSELKNEYSYLSQFLDLLRTNSNFLSQSEEISSSLCHIKDIRNTIDRLSNGIILDDIELYEIKNLTLATLKIQEILSNYNQTAIIFPNLKDVLSILDPENRGINSFYIYTVYDHQLSELRNKLNSCDIQYIDEINYKIAIIEERVRKEICKKLYLFTKDFLDSLLCNYKLDLLLAKAKQIIELNLSIPKISKNRVEHKGLFNPEVSSILKKENKTYQPIDIEFSNSSPKLITGSNMGGKSLTLKTIALSQIMFQFGMGVPSTSSHISIVEDIVYIHGDMENYSMGLSSFAAEMKRLDSLIKKLPTEQNILTLIDEPARTTNPLEGTALVSSLIKIISNYRCYCIITTHYHIKNILCDRVRVVGFDNGQMNYSLIDDSGKDIPMEALKIATHIGIDSQWINIAYKELETNNNNI